MAKNKQDDFKQNPANEDIRAIKPQTKLPQDNDPPFSEPVEASDDDNVDAHQETDTDIDKHEMYDAGKETASYQMHRDDVEEGVDDRLKNDDVVEKY